jgi:3-oxoacyl-[acyl-carrier-protein] synthase II
MARPDRRVVVTGLGLVTPLGNTVRDNSEALMAGRSGIGPITHFDASTYPSRIAGEVRNFDPGDFVEKKEIKKMDRFIHLAVAAAQEAVDDARFAVGAVDAERVGVIVGVGMGGIATIEETVTAYNEHGLRRVSPFFIPRLIANLAPGHIAIRVGAKGVNYAPASACSSGAHAVGEAYRLIRFGYQDAMIAGGAEAAVTPLGVGGFAAMRALSTRNEEPQRASRPFDRDRDGFVIAEGAGVLILETLEGAERRGARIYAEIAGYGANADAYHITSPSPDGEGAARCMQLALADGNLHPTEIEYINAHGTSTPYNDATETKAIKRVFGEHAARLAVSATKALTGHTLGAAGAIEAVYTMLVLQRQCIVPTYNYEMPDPECDLDYVPNQPRAAAVHVALSNSFGFGGTNVCLAFRRWP